MQVTTRKVLECLFDEFYKRWWAGQQVGIGEDLPGVEKELRGESKSKPRFRIPAADNGVDIFFDNQELFLRYAGMPTPTQRHFLIAIRQAMKVEGVERIEIRIPWSTNGFKKLEVCAPSMGPDGSLDFELLK